MTNQEPEAAKEKCKECGRNVKGEGQYRHCPLGHHPEWPDTDKTEFLLFGEAPPIRQVKKNEENTPLRSNCCQADVKVFCDPPCGLTEAEANKKGWPCSYWYVCLKCQKACDAMRHSEPGIATISPGTLEAYAIIDIREETDPFPLVRWTYHGENGKRSGIMSVYDKPPKIPKKWHRWKEFIKVTITPHD